MGIPCYVITLNPASEQTRTLLQALSDAGMSPEVYLGVDGRKGMPALESGEKIDVPKTLWRHQCQLTSSEVGAYLSHYRLIKRAYASGAKQVCIFEDDVELEPTFGPIIKELEQNIEKYEFVRLMGLKIRKRKPVANFADGVHQIVRPERGLLGTQGYMVNRDGMKKIVEYAGNIFEPIDKVYDHFYEYDLKSFGIEPHIILEKAHPTSIEKSNRGLAPVPLWIKVFYPLGKGVRSMQRHRYLRTHTDEFYPAEKPKQKPGRSVRMR